MINFVIDSIKNNYSSLGKDYGRMLGVQLKVKVAVRLRELVSFLIYDSCSCNSMLLHLYYLVIKVPSALPFSLKA